MPTLTMSGSVEPVDAFLAEDRYAFEAYLANAPSSRRVTIADKTTWTQWLTSGDGKSLTQTEHNRRHYVRKAFALDPDDGAIYTRPRSESDCQRRVVTVDQIAAVIEMVHAQSGHRGWDATWQEISRSYYGILRDDVIFLLKRCHVCAKDPRKRPKAMSERSPKSMADGNSDDGAPMLPG